MGGASSKAARSLPKGSASAVNSGGNVASSRPTPSRVTPQAARQSALDAAEQASPLSAKADDGRVGPIVERSEGGSETKDDRIRRDAFDPDFVSQLNDLGPVAVPPAPWQSPSANKNVASSSSRQPTPSSMMRILQARQTREDLDKDTQTTDPKHLDAPTLSELLNEIKAAKSIADVDNLATSYDFDRDTLRELVRRFNSPSIGEPVDAEEARFQEDRDSDRPPRIYAVWKEGDVRV